MEHFSVSDADATCMPEHTPRLWRQAGSAAGSTASPCSQSSASSSARVTICTCSSSPGTTRLPVRPATTRAHWRSTHVRREAMCATSSKPSRRRVDARRRATPSRAWTAPGTSGWWMRTESRVSSRVSAEIPRPSSAAGPTERSRAGDPRPTSSPLAGLPGRRPGHAARRRTRGPRGGRVAHRRVRQPGVPRRLGCAEARQAPRPRRRRTRLHDDPAPGGRHHVPPRRAAPDAAGRSPHRR